MEASETAAGGQQGRVISWPTRAWAFVKLGRPLFLAGGFAMHALGVAMALAAGFPLDLRLLILTQIAITATQFMTQYLNDYCDIEHDRANQAPTRWSGGSRVLVEGTLPPAAALIAALVLAGIALTAMLILGFTGRAAALPVLLTALFLAVVYSAPPFRLHTRGLGEIAAAITVAGLTPLAGFVAQSGRITALPLLGSLSLLPFQFTMLYSVALSDVEGDARSGKLTLAVKAARRAEQVYMAVIIAAYGLLPIAVLLGLPLIVAGSMLLTLPIALRLIWRVLHGAWRDPRHADSLAFGGVALLMCASLLETLAFLAVAGS